MEKFRKALDALSQREQRLTLGMLVVLVGVLAKFLIVGQTQELLALRSQLASDSITITQKEKMLQEFASARAPSASSNPAWAYYKENIGMSSLVRKISSKDNPEGAFHVMKIASEKVEKVNDYEKTSLKLEIEAPFNLIGGFLEDLEKSKLLTRVEGVEVTRLDKELKLCHAKISLNSYAWREK